MREHQRAAPRRALGKSVREALGEGASRRLEPIVHRAFAGEESETELVVEDIVLRVIAAPVQQSQGQIENVMLLTQDITDLVRAQQELQVRNRELREISFTDGLLNVGNRRAFDRQSELEWRRARRQSHSLALLMVDVDHFKVYNDTYGHGAGDRCLQKVAAVLDDALWRSGDFLARYGGEEFAVLLPDCDLAGALEVAQRVHDRLRERALTFPDSPTVKRVGVSIGAAACIPVRELTVADLVVGADQALYTAKAAGRNRTRVCEDLVRARKLASQSPSQPR